MMGVDVVLLMLAVVVLVVVRVVVLVVEVVMVLVVVATVLVVDFNLKARAVVCFDGRKVGLYFGVAEKIVLKTGE